MRMRRKPLLCLLQALILVIAQLGAQAHAYSHLAVAPHGPDGEPQRSHVLACSDCVAFAPLLATAGGATVPILHLPARASALIAAAALSAPRAFVHTAYRSRAPPPQP
jgi:hypothetical protein